VSELDKEKLPGFIELKYHSMSDAVVELKGVGEIRDVFCRVSSALICVVLKANLESRP
jgi:hypothetical protein